jgi:transmembrane sensor
MTDILNAPSGSIHEHAISWLTRLHSDNCTDQERHNFEGWLTQSEAHRTAYQEVAAFWQGLSQIEPHAAPQLAAARAYLRNARKSRRVLSEKRLAGILSVILLLGFSPLLWSWLTTDIYRTAKGESTSIQLSDGSRIDLNTDTELTVQYTWTSRSVKLEHGEALFSVVHNAERPFEVIASRGRILDIGTRFNVYRQAERVSVTVLEGEVSVAAKQNTIAQNLIPGQQISYDSAGQPSAILSVDTEAATAWKNRRLVFKSQSLSVVLEQLGRYHNAALQVQGSRLQALKVTGVFPTDNLNLALNTIASALPIKVTQIAANSFVLGAAD